MLYSPWRNENTDLLRGCETYQERFSKIKEVVFSNRQNYEYHSEILDKAMKDLDNDYSENISNSVAPNAQHINEQDIATNQNQVNCLAALIQGIINNIANMTCLMT